MSDGFNKLKQMLATRGVQNPAGVAAGILHKKKKKVLGMGAQPDEPKELPDTFKESKPLLPTKLPKLPKF